ncbi:unnamed protein product [Darwinula stevensoni]|uniref:REKLES domain-containing protein n=1 Tax=Darwinula stevensoni TaxID=69355 RepID=A0A7R9A2T0_9CRUS|nr:unnamed protein product [Darwinula stevensoni]CAG0886296.1 unnamed protein product [Darwinula stevensoni]
MKYLYPFECARQRLSSPEDLQAAIGANVRGDGKGKKSSSPSNFSTFQDLIHAGARGSPLPAQIPSIGMVQSRAGSMFNGNSTSPAAAAAAAHFLSSVPGFPASTNANAALLDMQARISMWNKLLLNHMGGEEPQEKGAGGGRREELERHLLGSGIIPPPQYEALNLADAKKSCSSEKRSYSPPLSSKKGNKRSWAEIDDNEDDRLDRHRSNTSPRTTIKISSRGESEGGGVDNSIVVCLEVNEVVYQGVLFAQKKRDCIS